MSIAEEIAKLDGLRRAGTISEEEFVRAKSALLHAPPPIPAPATASVEQQTRQWAMFIHFSLLAGLAIPWVGLLLPIILWQIKKNDLPGVDPHGKAVTNWIISATIYGAGCFILAFVLIGIPLLIALAICNAAFAIIGGARANEGTVWRYPLSIQFIK